MEPRNRPIALLISLLAGCTGYLEPGAGSGAAVDGANDASSDLAQPGAAQARNEDSADRLNLDPRAPWAGAVGSWCGPGDGRSLWLTARPASAACSDLSRSVYGDGPSESFTLALDESALTSFPARVSARARYCPPGGVACVDVPAELEVERYSLDSGLEGSWSLSVPGADGRELRGRVTSSTCDWDSLLPPHPDAERLARDISLREVSVYQGVKVPIARGVEAVLTRNADLVQEREAMVRVFVDPGPRFVPRELSARITLQDPGAPPRRFEQTLVVERPSTDPDGTSTFNLELPKDAFKADTQYSVELRETSRCVPLSGAPVGARVPEQGLLPVGARYTGPVKVMVVPVRYDSDGSGRLPDTSPSQLEKMAQQLYSMYPTNEVVLSLHEVVATDRTDLSDMLDQVRQLRDADAPPSDLAYYGMVRPAESFEQYCNGTCTTGIAGFGSQNGTSGAGMGIGYTDAAANTFVHELGHVYRRPHSPCGGAIGADETYPYPNGGLGSWGYDLRTGQLFAPETHVDFMSYCSPDWISDHNYQRILERVVLVNQHAAPRSVIGVLEPRPYRTLRVPRQGQPRWGLDLRPLFDPPGDPITLEALDVRGNVVELVPATFQSGAGDETAYFVPGDHPEWHAIRAPGGATLPYGAPSENRPFSR
jgi:hypothetical protein